MKLLFTVLLLCSLSLFSHAQNRPQEPRPPFPYTAEDVHFRNEAAGITLAGTLTLPEGNTPHPVVVLVSGSGPQDRNEEILGHKPFGVIADYLSRQGIAVLRYDDRGVGASEGIFSTATTSDFATDAAAALQYLKTRSDIDHAKMGIVGHSEGGAVAFMQAAHNKDVAFIVSLAGPGIKGQDLILEQAKMTLLSQGMPALAWAFQEPVLRERYAILSQDKPIEEVRKEFFEQLARTTPGINMEDKTLQAQVAPMLSPWYIAMLKYDPTEDLTQIKCPVLALNGEEDIQIPAELSLNAIETHIKSNGNRQVQTKIYPGLNHLFQHCESCTITEYGQLEETISQEVLQDIVHWLKQTLRHLL